MYFQFPLLLTVCSYDGYNRDLLLCKFILVVFVSGFKRRMPVCLAVVHFLSFDILELHNFVLCDKVTKSKVILKNSSHLDNRNVVERSSINVSR